MRFRVWGSGFRVSGSRVSDVKVLVVLSGGGLGLKAVHEGNLAPRKSLKDS